MSSSDSIWDYWAPIFDGEFSDFRDLDDIINIVMSLVCITGAALGKQYIVHRKLFKSKYVHNVN